MKKTEENIYTAYFNCSPLDLCLFRDTCAIKNSDLWNISEKRFKMPAKVFEHFEMSPNATGNVKVRCKHCGSVISGPVQTTSNFVAHLWVCTLALECHNYELLSFHSFIYIPYFLSWRVLLQIMLIISNIEILVLVLHVYENRKRITDAAFDPSDLSAYDLHIFMSATKVSENYKDKKKIHVTMTK